MRGKRIAGVGALAVAVSIGGPALAAESPTLGRLDQQQVVVDGTVAKVGDEVTARCPAGMKLQYGDVYFRDTVTAPSTYHAEELPGRGGWVVRVVSTERTAPWTISAVAGCTTEDGRYPSPTDFVEVPGTLITADDEVIAHCPATSTQAIPSISGEQWKYREEMTPDGLGSIVRRCETWDGPEPVNVAIQLRCYTNS